jgi:hypothetical protein
MSAWVVITDAYVKGLLVGAQLNALRTAALAPGQADPFPDAMHDVANYVRNRISNKINISATPYAVPPELKRQAGMLIIEALQTRLPSLRLSEDQVRAITKAGKDLDIAGTPQLYISTPDDPVAPDVQSGGSIEIITKPRTTINRDSMRGL